MEIRRYRAVSSSNTRNTKGRVEPANAQKNQKIRVVSYQSLENSSLLQAVSRETAHTPKALGTNANSVNWNLVLIPITTS